MTSNSKYFDGDCVYRVTRKGRVQFGLVVENGEYLSSDSDDDDEPSETQPSRMTRGRIRVAWHPKGQTEIHPENAVKLHDRFLTPGEVVRRVVSGQDSQLGYCRSTKISATLHVLGTNYVIDNVDSADLQPLEKFRKDSAISVGGTWTGLIQMIKRELALRFPDRSVCILQENDASGLEDVVHRRTRLSELPSGRFYEGQQLHGPMRTFNSARWLYRTAEVMAYPPDKHVQVTVLKVQPVEAYARSLSPQGESTVIIHFCDTTPGPPPAPRWPPGEARQEPERQPQPEAAGGGEELADMYPKCDIMDKGDVQAAEVYEIWGLPLGSRRLYELQAADMIDLELWRQACAMVYGPPGAASRSVPAGPKDGSNCDDSQPVGPKDLTLVSGASAEEGGEMPVQPLLECGCPLPKQLTLHPGDVVVTETLATVTHVEVVWQDGTVESDVRSTDLYPVLHMDENEFFPGDFVMENTGDAPSEEYGVVQRVDHWGRTAEVAKYRMYTVDAENPQPEELGVEEVSVYNIREHPELNYKPTYFVAKGPIPDVEGAVVPVGQVVDILPPGQITIRWLDGTTSQCYPQELVPCLRSHYHPDDDLEDESDDYMDLLDEGDFGEPVVGGPPVGVSSRAQQLFERMQGQVEVLRASVARLEESITQHPVVQSNAATRRLAELYRQSNQLLQFVGASCLQWGWTSLPRQLLMQFRRLFSPPASPPQPAGQQGAHDGGTSVNQEQLDHCYAAEAAASSSSKQESPPSTSSPQRLTQMSLSQLLNHIVLQSRNFQSRLSSILSRACGSARMTPEQRSIGTSTQELPREAAPAVARADPGRMDEEEPVSSLGGAGLEGTGLAGNEPGLSCPDVVFRSVMALPRGVDTRALVWPVPPELGGTLPLNRHGAGEAASLELPETATGPDDREEKSDGDKRELSFLEKVGQRLAELLEAQQKEEAEKARGSAGDNKVDDVVVFSLMKTAPETHSYKHVMVPPNDLKAFTTVVRKEMQLLSSNLPDSIVVKSFEDRSDLYSALIRGPRGTPYEDGLFLFDLKLPANYPHSPPLCHYHSFCRERLNPNLYVDGKVCVSLLGTWDGKGTEVWSPKSSNLLQLFVSIQGLILVAEPYYNEAGFEQQLGCPQASENSRVYNEKVILKVLQSMQAILVSQQEIFKEEIELHFAKNVARYVARLESWIQLSNAWRAMSSEPSSSFEGALEEFAEQGGYGMLPDFPLLPASRGFCLAVGKELAVFRDLLWERGIDCSAADEGGQSR